MPDRLSRRSSLTALAALPWLATGSGRAKAGSTANKPLTPMPAAAASAPAKVWRVGPGQALTRIADALQRAGEGDTVEVLPGIYRGDVAVITQRRLRIVGLSERPWLHADGQHAEGKAIWVVRHGDVQIENIGFRGCRVPDGNGAGIRFERGHLRLSGCAFTDHEIGLLTSNHAEASLALTRCEFSDAPVNPVDLSHLVYVGRIGRLRVEGCRFRGGREGHLLKSRARESLITGNRFDDGQDGQASYEIDLPNGGVALVERNTVVQSPLTRNPVMLAYGAEGGHWPENRLTLRDNTFVNHLPASGWFVRVWAERLPAATAVLSQRNRYLGAGSLALGPQGRSIADQRGAVP